MVQQRLERLVDAARDRLDSEHPVAPCSSSSKFCSPRPHRKDLIDAPTGAGIDVHAHLATTGAEVRAHLGLLLARAQQVHHVRADVTATDLMALIAGILRSQHAPDTADPDRALAVIRDGMQTKQPPVDRPFNT